MKAMKKETSENTKSSISKKVKINKKLDDLKNIQSDKQEEVNKLIFKLSI